MSTQGPGFDPPEQPASPLPAGPPPHQPAFPPPANSPGPAQQLPQEPTFAPFGRQGPPTWQPPPQPMSGPPGYGPPHHAAGPGAQPIGVPPGSRRSGTSGKAIAALVLGVLFCVPLGGVAAVVLGLLGIRDINRSGGALGGRVAAVIGIVLGLVQTLVTIAAVAFLVANPDIFDDVPTSEPSTVFDVGDCLDLPTDQTEGVTFRRSDVQPCDEPHDAEYLGNRELSGGTDEAFPGDDAVFEEGVDLCLDEFQRATGRDLLDDPDLDVFVLYPQELGWNLLDQRGVDCFIISVDGSPLTAPVLD